MSPEDLDRCLERFALAAQDRKIPARAAARQEIRAHDEALRALAEGDAGPEAGVQYHVMVVRTQGRRTTTATLGPEPLYPLTEQEPTDAWIEQLGSGDLQDVDDRVMAELAAAVRVLRDGAA